MDEAADDTIERHVAIIGMACRLPGAADVEAYWQNLSDGVESISSFSDEELLASGVDPEVLRSPHYVRSRGVIGGADLFDAAFFGFTPREAELLDPQQRVFLECAWHALEDGAYVPGGAERIAVFGGVGTNWHLGSAHRHPDVRKFSSPASVVIANDKDYLTTRVSYKLGLTGPSVNVQSACSTSLVATIMGMNSLLSHQCDLALAGGATVEIPEKNGYLFQDGGMESPDGHCRPFDAGANGTVFSRGAGVVLLKRLGEAIEDGDHIHAVILDGAINNDGAVKAGFTAPSVNGQVEVAIEALERAGVTPETLSFVEAHGTATSLGDPIEVASLSQAFRPYTDRNQFCALGSAKGNIGHTDVASGAAGLIKAALALEHRKLPASLNFQSPNPKIDFGASPFFVNTKPLELERNGTPLRAMINSFGVGGTNACAVLQEPPPRAASVARRKQKLLLLSARTPAALEAVTQSMAAHVEAHPDADLDAMAYTSQVGRRSFKHRRTVVFGGRDELRERLAGAGPEPLNHGVCEDDGRPVLFAFPGQGNQYVGMGRGLYETEPAYRDSIDAASELLGPILGTDLRDLLHADGDSADAAAALLNETRFTQPALFATSYAAARLWSSWGVQPAAMIGHSVGEYVAGCLAGVFSFEDALTAVAHRARLIQALPGGSMLAVLLTEDETVPLLTPGLAVAAVNGPKLTVVSGPTPAIAALEERLAEMRVFSKRLDTSHAFHSEMVDPALPEFARVLADVPLRAPTVPIASTLTGTWLTAEEATSTDYWVQHMRKPVRFLSGLQTLLASGAPSVLLECGPGHSLTSAAKHQVKPDGSQAVVGSMRAYGEPGSDAEWMLAAVGGLWMGGATVDWRAFHGDSPPGRVPLPGYPFERQRFSLDFSKLQGAEAAAKDDKKKPDVGDWFYVPGWKRSPRLDLERAPAADETDGGGHVWLVFEDGLGLAVELYALVQRGGDDVVGVRAGHEFRQIDESTFAIRPGVRGDYEELVAALKDSGRVPDRLLHLWNVDGDTTAPSLGTVERAEVLAFYSPLFVQQALIGQGVSGDLRMIVAADGVFDVAGDRVSCPAKALALGPCRVVGKEAPPAKARFVDVVAPSAEGAAPRLAEQLLREIELDTEETVAAYRGTHRWAETFDAVRLDAAGNLGSRLRPGGHYLVTGGLGGLGLFFAGQIAERVPARLVLTHRSPMPERDEWAAWLDAHADDDATSERIRGVLALEEAGATVALAQADCADLAQMEALVRDEEARFGAFHGVIHAAGVVGGGIISLKGEEQAAEVLAPKVRGTLVLDRLFGAAQLDFMLLFSSITSVLGEVGRVDYCAANNFMDALAHHCRERSRDSAVSSIDWGPWGEFGMAARWEAAKGRRQSAAAAPASAEDGSRLRFAGEEDGRELYDVLLDPAADWVINSHSVVGVPTVVGTTYIELIHQLVALKSPGAAAAVEHLAFSSPLMFPPGAAKRIRLFVEEAQGTLRFSFKSQTVDGGRPGMWHDHCVGELRVTRDDPPARVDLEALRARCAAGVDTRRFNGIGEDGAGEGAQQLELGPRWNCLEAVHVGSGEWLARLELPGEFAADRSDYAFHPAMTDVALAAAIPQVADGDDGTFYLPFDYGRIRLKAGYPSSLWSHIRRSATEPDGDTLSFEVTILDDEGSELATFERYTLKKVAGPGSAREAPARVAPPSAVQSEERLKDILPAEGLDALERIMSAPLQPQIVVSTSSLDAQIEDAIPGRAREDADAPGSDDAAVYARPSLSTPYEEPANEIERAVAEIWQGILGISQIGAYDDFTELGGNSLLAVQAAATTSDTYQLELTVEAFLRSPTVRGVAETVVGMLVSLAGEDKLEELLADMEE